MRSLTQAQIEPVGNGWKANVLTTRLLELQQWSNKMLYLNQTYEKKAMEGYAWLQVPAWLLHD